MKVHVVTHTHWDREWYVTFEIFRGRLVEMINDLLEKIDEHPSFKHFMLDGQVVVLEDYLQISPEKKEKLLEEIRKGRIIVGPWYVLPDEFLISGESLIRNFLMGQKILKKWNLPSMKVGYLPDMFGHNAYTPTVLKGLGMEWAILWRGVGKACRDTEFEWISPSGDSVKVVNLIKDGYSNAAHFGAPLNALKDKFKSVISELSKHATTGNILLMNGTDHEMPLLDLPDKFDDWGREFGVELIHSTLEKYVSDVDYEKPNLTKVIGELRDPTYEPVLKDVTSTRVYIKLLNFEDQILYTRYVEPLSTTSPSENILEALKTGWKEILKSHPHDSICGCSVDRVHRDVEVRLNSAREIGVGILSRILNRSDLGSSVTFLNVSEIGGKFAIEAYVPLEPGVYELEGGRKAWVKEVPLEGTLSLYRIGGDDHLKMMSFIREFQRSKSVARVLSLPMGKLEIELDLTGLSSKTLRIVKRISNIPGEDRSPNFSGNFYDFKLNDDGTFDVEDKTNCVKYTSQGVLIDVGDCGDEYNFSPLPGDTPIHPLNVEKVEVEPTIFGKDVIVDGILKIPESLSKDRKGRSKNTVENPVRIRYRLFNDIPRIDLRIDLKNQSKDHKLLLRFKNPERISKVVNDGYFGIVEHPTEMSPDPQAVEEVISRYAMESFVGLLGERAKFMIVTRGLHEYETHVGKDGTTLDITLLRAVGWLSRGDLSTRRGHAGPALPTPEAQCIGNYSLLLSMVLLKEGSPVEMYSHQRIFLLSPIVLVPGIDFPSLKFFEAEEGVFLSTMKISESGDGIILRFFNPTGSEKRVRTRRKCKLVNMAEEFLGEESSEFTIPPLKVLSVECPFQS